MEVKFGCTDTWTHKNWEIEIDMEAFCSLEGKKIKDPETNKKIIAYPMAKARKMFDLMVRTMEQEELDKVHGFLELKSKKYADVFQQIRQKRR